MTTYTDAVKIEQQKQHESIIKQLTKERDWIVEQIENSKDDPNYVCIEKDMGLSKNVYGKLKNIAKEVFALKLDCISFRDVFVALVVLLPPVMLAFAIPDKNVMSNIIGPILLFFVLFTIFFSLSLNRVENKFECFIKENIKTANRNYYITKTMAYEYKEYIEKQIEYENNEFQKSVKIK